MGTPSLGIFREPQRSSPILWRASPEGLAAVCTVSFLPGRCDLKYSLWWSCIGWGSIQYFLFQIFSSISVVYATPMRKCEKRHTQTRDISMWSECKRAACVLSLCQRFVNSPKIKSTCPKHAQGNFFAKFPRVCKNSKRWKNICERWKKVPLSVLGTCRLWFWTQRHMVWRSFVNVRHMVFCVGQQPTGKRSKSYL